MGYVEIQRFNASTLVRVISPSRLAAKRRTRPGPPRSWVPFPSSTWWSWWSCVCVCGCVWVWLGFGMRVVVVVVGLGVGSYGVGGARHLNRCLCVSAAKGRTAVILRRMRDEGGLAQWLACWAQVPKLCGSKPQPATPNTSPRSAALVRRDFGYKIVLPCLAVLRRSVWRTDQLRSLPCIHFIPVRGGLLLGPPAPSVDGAPQQAGVCAHSP